MSKEEGYDDDSGDDYNNDGQPDFSQEYEKPEDVYSETEPED